MSTIPSEFKDEALSLDDDDANEIATLTSVEGEVFRLPLAAAKQSTLVAVSFENDSSAREFACVQVKAPIMRLVVDYMLHHHAHGPAPRIERPLKHSKIKEILSEWDYQFVTPLLVGNCKQLFDLMLAANYLDIKPLFEMCCATMAAIMKTKPPEQVAKMLNVDINLSEAEWEALRRENAWAEAPEPLAP